MVYEDGSGNRPQESHRGIRFHTLGKTIHPYDTRTGLRMSVQQGAAPTAPRPVLPVVAGTSATGTSATGTQRTVHTVSVSGRVGREATLSKMCRSDKEFFKSMKDGTSKCEAQCEVHTIGGEDVLASTEQNDWVMICSDTLHHLNPELHASIMALAERS